MKRKILIGILPLLLLTGCNKQLIDTKYTFKYADIEGVGKIEISSWKDFDYSDMIQVTGKNGVTYCTHSSRVVLMSK